MYLFLHCNLFDFFSYSKIGGEKSELEVQLSESKEKLSRCQEDLQNAKDQLHIKVRQVSECEPQFSVYFGNIY